MEKSFSKFNQLRTSNASVLYLDDCIHCMSKNEFLKVFKIYLKRMQLL